jgi:hypothetical protein
VPVVRRKGRVILIALAKVVLGTYVPLMLAAMDGRR